jgi:hypothetical protein
LARLVSYAHLLAELTKATTGKAFFSCTATLLVVRPDSSSVRPAPAKVLLLRGVGQGLLVVFSESVELDSIVSCVR